MFAAGSAALPEASSEYAKSEGMSENTSSSEVFSFEVVAKNARCLIYFLTSTQINA
jgi:hypothetical protein